MLTDDEIDTALGCSSYGGTRDARKVEAAVLAKLRKGVELPSPQLYEGIYSEGSSYSFTEPINAAHVERYWDEADLLDYGDRRVVADRAKQAALAQKEAQPVEPVAYLIYAGLGNMRPVYPAHRTLGDAQEFAGEIKSVTKIVPLYTAPGTHIEVILPRAVVEQPSYDMSIHSNPDAQAWAKFFIKTQAETGFTIDEGLMISWFANAMMAMHDYLKQSKASTIEEIRGAVARGWCTPENSHKVMDATLALAIADSVCAALQSRCLKR